MQPLTATKKEKEEMSLSSLVKLVEHCG